MRCSCRFALIGLVLALLAGCDGGSTGSSGNQADTGWNGSWDTSYTVNLTYLEGNRILAHNSTTVMAYCSKMNGTNMLAYDTNTGDDTTVYRLAGNTLLLGGGDTNTLQPTGTKLVRWTRYTRTSGTGLYGTWSVAAESLEVVGTSLPADSLDKHRKTANEDGAARLGAGYYTRATLSATTAHLEMGYSNWAKLRVANLGNTYVQDGSYLLTPAMKSPVRVTLVGGVTKDTVTLEALAPHAIRYSSTDTSRHTYVDYTSPQQVSQCPEKEWFWEFIWANHKKAT